MSMGQDEFSNPAWRKAMATPLMGTTMPLLNQPVGNLDFAGIASPQEPVPGISQLLAQIPDAKSPIGSRADRLARNAFAEYGTPLPARLVGTLTPAQRQRSMNRRSQGGR